MVGAALVLLRGDAAQQDDDVFQLQIQHEDGHRELGDSRGHLVRTLARDDVLDAHCDPQEHIYVRGHDCDGGLTFGGERAGRRAVGEDERVRGVK